MPRSWTQTERQAQAEKISQTKPWSHSTGPRTALGKARSCMNATTHGATTARCRAELKALSNLLRNQRLVMAQIRAEIRRRRQSRLGEMRQFYKNLEFQKNELITSVAIHPENTPPAVDFQRFRRYKTSSRLKLRTDEQHDTRLYIPRTGIADTRHGQGSGRRLSGSPPCL